MRILAVDSATEACSAALFEDGAVSELYEVIGRGHADRLLPMVDSLLKTAGRTVADLDCVAFGRGPGGFTGLRIAAGMAQGLAAGAGIGVLPVSDLAALAAEGARIAGASRILACLNARMGEVYWAAFDCSGARPIALGDEMLTQPGAVALPGGESWFGVGHGFAAYPALKTRFDARLEGLEPALLPRAADIARIAAVDFAAGLGLRPTEALPVYLRNEVVHRR
ncbi:MAG: tRNA (adenosine(37)-N6)-threonylcarbamoyltransferase complex dimerization subunit type 1 TsaB [Steroidobacteraceae bacterium]